MELSVHWDFCYTKQAEVDSETEIFFGWHTEQDILWLSRVTYQRWLQYYICAASVYILYHILSEQGNIVPIIGKIIYTSHKLHRFSITVFNISFQDYKVLLFRNAIDDCNTCNIFYAMYSLWNFPLLVECSNYYII